MAESSKFKCPKCERTFSMAPHLGRHLSTIHGAKKGKKTLKKKVARRAFRRKRGQIARTAQRQSATMGAGIAGAIGELSAYRDQLAAQRTEVDAQIAAVESALAALGASAGGAQVRASGRRPSFRQGSLKDHIARVLGARRGPMSVKDITAAVRRAGYRSKNKTLDKSVGNSLGKMRQVVKVARGQYRLRG
jgi:uncharacterized C2H2 Zn-finger protein